MRGVKGILGGLVVMLVLLLAAPALAAFPGANGLLAVQPVSGGGIVLVAVNGRHARRICTLKKRCGTPHTPRWSPDGRAIVFGGSKMDIVFTDGSCMDCQLGVAAQPAFEPDGTVISFIRDRRTLLKGIDGLDVRFFNPVASDAVWSADGKLAFVRNGVLWAGPRNKLRKVAAASEPSWAPGAQAIAAVQHGWVVIVRLRDHHVQRVARGSAPAFSPDGRLVAYVAPDHRLMIIPARGGRPTPVGNIRAVSVDWQPKPRGRNPGCVAPAGSTVLASGPAAVITSDGQSLQSPADVVSFAIMGCLRANGRERLLERFVNNPDNEYTVPYALLAHPYGALLVDDSDPHYGGSGTAVEVFDLRTGTRRTDLGNEATPTCPGFIQCILDQVALGSDGVSAAHIQMVEPAGTASTPFTKAACPPGGTVCIAVDEAGNLFTSSDLSGAGPRWLSGGNVGWTVTCPSQSLCVGAGGDIYTSSDPPTGAPGWTDTPLFGGRLDASDISCPTVSLCVVADGAGITASANPTGGAQAWTTTSMPRGEGSVVCSAEPRCFATNAFDLVDTSTDPTGGTSAWTASPGTPPFTAGDCPSASLCVIVGGQGIYTSTEPDAAVWNRLAGGQFTGVSCPSVSFCVAVGGQGALAYSTDPASRSWTEETIDAGRNMTSVSCASVSLCVATDQDGHVVTSTNPIGGYSAWSPTLLEGDPCTDGTSCSIEDIEVTDKAGVHDVDSSKQPGSGPFLTSLTLNGDTLSWSHDGSPRSVTLTPP